MASFILSVTGLVYATMAVGADASAKPAVSNFYLPETQSSFAINLSPDSDDVNFYITSPTWYSYFAVGIGSSMTNSLMLVAYPAADNQHITVSTRLGTGDSEPPYYSGAKVSLSQSSSIQNNSIVTSGTCTGCRSWPGGSLDTNTTTQSFIYALGPNLALTSDDVAAGLKRHIGYGQFTMNTIQATGTGGVDVLTTVDNTVSAGAAEAGAIQSDSDSGALAHGLIFALATLVFAPVDMLTADALRRWPVLHILTSIAFLAMVFAGFGLGIRISGEYLSSQKLNSPHQILGFLIAALMLILLVAGALAHVGRIKAVTRGEQHIQRRGMLAKVHMGGGWLLWVLLFVNCGLGLQFASASTIFIIGFVVLAFGVLIAVVMVKLCLYCCFRKEKAAKEEDAHQLATLYDH